MNTTPIVIVSNKAGRLGNRLFQSAHFMGNALSHGYRLLNPSFDEYAGFFEGSASDPLCATPCVTEIQDHELASQLRAVFFFMAGAFSMPCSKIFSKRMSLFDIRDLDETDDPCMDLNTEGFQKLLRPGSVTFVKGWRFTDHLNLVRFRDQIVRYHTPVQSIIHEAENVVAHARDAGKSVIGVHVRQEDYRFWKGGVHFYETELYAQWMRKCAEIYEDVVFLVCASNKLDFDGFRGLNVVYGPGFPVGDLHALSLCDRIMGPPSTFSMWASYFGNTPLCILQRREQIVIRENFTLHH